MRVELPRAKRPDGALVLNQGEARVLRLLLGDDLMIGITYIDDGVFRENAINKLRELSNG